MPNVAQIKISLVEILLLSIESLFRRVSYATTAFLQNVTVSIKKWAGTITLVITQVRVWLPSEVRVG